MTATIAPPPPATVTIAVDCLHRFTVDEYQQLIEVGILPEGAPIELLEGLLVRKMSRNPSRDQAMRRLTHHHEEIVERERPDVDCGERAIVPCSEAV